MHIGTRGHSTGQGHETVIFGCQDVKGQGHEAKDRSGVLTAASFTFLQSLLRFRPIYALCPQKVVHQTHGDNFANS